MIRNHSSFGQTVTASVSVRAGGRASPSLQWIEWPYDESHVRMRLEDGRRPSEGSGRQHVVGRDQHGVLAVGPLEQALVVGGDVAAIDAMAAYLDPIVRAVRAAATSALSSGDASSMISTRTSTPSWPRMLPTQSGRKCP